eukprot:CAMPEP_0174276908 /NCGR_PEP_ID=MMETSP0439-20130205/60643_1 /TAXON_ID=0 /ORGANISM="Stereomyxa ramosa, Strain Chinc5" /LENGTH=689 /DNA_ID=CAMNT_0015369181 /DNA_START=422 /DNA_END=2492 /DNA_ORIENTATION=-
MSTTRNNISLELVDQFEDKYLNRDYRPPSASNSSIIPCVGLKNLALWHFYYLRFGQYVPQSSFLYDTGGHLPHTAEKSPADMGKDNEGGESDVETENKYLKEKIKELKRKLKHVNSTATAQHKTIEDKRKEQNFKQQISVEQQLQQWLLEKLEKEGLNTEDFMNEWNEKRKQTENSCVEYSDDSEQYSSSDESDYSAINPPDTETQSKKQETKESEPDEFCELPFGSHEVLVRVKQPNKRKSYIRTHPNKIHKQLNNQETDELCEFFIQDTSDYEPTQNSIHSSEQRGKAANTNEQRTVLKTLRVKQPTNPRLKRLSQRLDAWMMVRPRISELRDRNILISLDDEREYEKPREKPPVPSTPPPKTKPSPQRALKPQPKPKPQTPPTITKHRTYSRLAEYRTSQKPRPNSDSIKSTESKPSYNFSGSFTLDPRRTCLESNLDPTDPKPSVRSVSFDDFKSRKVDSESPVSSNFLEPSSLTRSYSESNFSYSSDSDDSDDEYSDDSDSQFDNFSDFQDDKKYGNGNFGVFALSPQTVPRTATHNSPKKKESNSVLSGEKDADRDNSKNKEKDNNEENEDNNSNHLNDSNDNNRYPAKGSHRIKRNFNSSRCHTPSPQPKTDNHNTPRCSSFDPNKFNLRDKWDSHHRVSKVEHTNDPNKKIFFAESRQQTVKEKPKKNKKTGVLTKRATGL